jgi:hypothetical protein
MGMTKEADDDDDFTSEASGSGGALKCDRKATSRAVKARALTAATLSLVRCSVA